MRDDGLLHGSGANTSARIRCGIAMRFSPTDVKGNLDVWPTFEATMARGIDACGHIPIANVLTDNGFLARKFQPSSDFA